MSTDLDLNPADIRAWARARGMTVGKRGRMSKALIEQYQAEMRLSDDEIARYDLGDPHG